MPPVSPSVSSLDLTILMPCLNESETVTVCITKALRWLGNSGLSGEVLIADNGSTDGSRELAVMAGARVVPVAERGYGAALRAGIESAHGRWVIMGDADDSYDFGNLDGFVHELRSGAELVVGNRFAGGVMPGAMPFLHRYLGNPVLSRLGRMMFRVPLGDFHCGLRGGDTQRLCDLNLRTPGMEFASEMIVRASMAKLRIAEVPTVLSPDGRTRSPHLRTWNDGWRHLRFMLLFSPAWMFMYPGCIMAAVGLMATIRLSFGDVLIGSVRFSGTTLVAAAMTVMIGFQLVLFDMVSTAFAAAVGLGPPRARAESIAARFRLERGLVLGGLLAVAGVTLGIVSVVRWSSAGWGDLKPVEQLRIAVPAGLFSTLGASVFFGSLLLSSIGVDRRLSFAQPSQQRARSDRSEQHD